MHQVPRDGHRPSHGPTGHAAERGILTPCGSIQPRGRRLLPTVGLTGILLLTACGGGSDGGGATAANNCSAPTQQGSAVPGRRMALAATVGSSATELLADGVVSWVDQFDTAGRRFVSVQIDQLTAGVTSTSSVAHAPDGAVSAVATGYVARQLVAGVWVSEATMARQYTVAVDGTIEVRGGRLGSEGYRGALVAEDLAGRPLTTLPWVAAGTAGVFPSGSLLLRLGGAMAAARYRTSWMVGACGARTLAACVDLLQTPTDGSAPANTVTLMDDNPARLSYSFDGPLAASGGRVSVWRTPPSGVPTRLGGGVYREVTVDAASFLQFDAPDAEVLAQLDVAAQARFARGERVLVATANGRVWSGSLLPAGSLTDQDAALRLNRNASDALAAALGLTAAAVPAPRTTDGSTPGGATGGVLGGDIVTGSGTAGGTTTGGITLGGNGTVGSTGTVGNAGTTGTTGNGGTLTIGAGGSLTVTGAPAAGTGNSGVVVDGGSGSSCSAGTPG